MRLHIQLHIGSSFNCQTLLQRCALSAPVLPPSKAGGLLGSFELNAGLKEEQLGTEADGAVVGGRGGGFHLFINIFIFGMSACCQWMDGRGGVT